MLLGSTMYVGRERLMLRDKVVYEKKTPERDYVKLCKPCQYTLTHLVGNKRPKEIIKLKSDLHRFIFMEH